MNTPFRSRLFYAGLPIVLALLIGALGLRLWNLNEPSIWHDEGWSIRAIRDPINTPDDNTPPLYYATMHLLWWGGGESPLALRYGSGLLDMVMIALAVRLMRRWTGWEAAILTAGLLGLSPLLWAYAREIRAYVAVPLLAVLLLGLVDRLLDSRAPASTQAIFPWRVGGVLLLAELALLYTHNLSVPVVGWLNLAVIGVWVWQRRWRWLLIWTGGQAALLLAYIPWLLTQSPSGTALNTPPQIAPSLLWDIWQGYFAPLPTMIGAENALVVTSAVFGAAAVLSIGSLLAGKASRTTLLVLSQAIMLPLLATVELRVAHIDFHPRYYVAGVPAAMMVIAFGVASLPEKWEMRRLAAPGMLALAAGASAAALVPLIDRPKYQHDDFRAITAYYATLPADTVIVIPYGWEPAIEEYYAEKLDLRAELVGIDLHSDPETVITQINAALAGRSDPVRLELLTWYQLPADVRGMYPCLLESAGQRVGLPVTVQGITTQGYLLSDPIQLVPISDQHADYGMIRLDEAAWGGTQAVCLQSTWTLPAATDQDWRAAGRLLTIDPPGWIIARSDTDIRRDDQLPTSDWKAGDSGASFSLLRFPNGAPPDRYQVQIGVYSQDHPNGLDQLVNGIPSGKTRVLTTVRPAHTTDQPFSPPPPVPVAISLSAGADDTGTLELVGHDAAGGTLTPGQEMRITLYWHLERSCCETLAATDAALVLRGEGWSVVQPVEAYMPYSLDWHALVVPAEASGPAMLALEADDVFPLAKYTIEPSEHLFSAPAYDITVQTEFNGLAVLEGFSLAHTTVVAPSEPVNLTLVWRVVETPPVSYRVFTHLLNTDGRVIAQHDAYPVNRARLTTSWVRGEYLVDPYALEFNEEGRNYRGPAWLEVGFYDPDTGNRVQTAGGADHIVLPVEIVVE
jgi:hypothetical protein